MIAVVSAAPVHAREVYQWVDANGLVHLSDTPPANAPQAQVRRLVVTVPPAAEPAEAPAPVAPSPAQVLPPSAPPPVPQPAVVTVVQPATPSLTQRDGWFFAVLPAPPVSNPALGEAQQQALAERGLDGPRRPISINSSVHAQRVARSQTLSTRQSP